ncbi:DUF2339 domain-containing protein [Propioniciclava soli]|uniref:DUF2339 domain-containing protein n=1 Tax=Propioniciclava soli TaxID=2775081 RepID=A0ABZ3C5F5_9ACTN
MTHTPGPDAGRAPAASSQSLDDPDAITARIRGEIAEVSRGLVRLAGDLDALAGALALQQRTVAGDAAAQDAAARDAPGQDTPGQGAPGQGASGQGTSGQGTSGQGTSRQDAPGRPPLGTAPFPGRPAGQAPFPAAVPWGPPQVVPGRPGPAQDAPARGPGSPAPQPTPATQPTPAHPSQRPAAQLPAPPRSPRPPSPPRPPRRPVSLAEIFAIVGSGVTLIGVALVLLMPQDGFLGPLARTTIGLSLAAAAVAAAFWQHRFDPKNIGAQALFATGVASTFLCLVALTAIFTDPAGRPLLAVLPGLVLAGLVSLAGVWVAVSWRSQWLAVLAMLGSLVLAPLLSQNDRLAVLAFMLVLTVASGAFQRAVDWPVLVLARTLPTGLVFLAMTIDELLILARGGADSLILLALVTALALCGLLIAVMHQRNDAGTRVAAVIAFVLFCGPLLVGGWNVDKLPSVAAYVVVGAVATAAGFWPQRVHTWVRAAAIPLGALFLAVAALRAFDAAHQGYLWFGLAIAYLAVAERVRFRPVMVVGVLLAGVGALVWLPSLVSLVSLQAVADGRLGIEHVVQSVLGLVATLLVVRALRLDWPEGGHVLNYAVWVGTVLFGTVAVVLAGTLLGHTLGDVANGFQVAHAVATVSWMALSVALLSRGLRRASDAQAARHIAIALAAAAVAKLFLFDLGALPGLARALAFIVVGILLLVIGTWYHGQLEKVRRATAEPTPGADADPAVQPAPAVQPDPSAAPAPGPDADPMR